MDDLGLSQSELARRVGVAQPTIYKLIRRNKIGSKFLHLIARELGTTPAFLTGETDDPDLNAPPPPPPAPVRIMMEIALPEEAILEQMFEALLGTIDPDADRAEIALLLAQRLPIGLSQLQELRPGQVPSPRRRAGQAVAHASDATRHPERVR